MSKVTPEWSPPGKGKSPSTTRHDLKRRHVFQSRCGSLLLRDHQDEADEVPRKETEMNDKLSNLHETTSETLDVCNEISKIIDQETLTESCRSDQIKCDHAAYSNEETKVEDTSPKEIQFKSNLANKDRNTKFQKIVHDTRDGQSLVYRLTDDFIILVDEEKMKYTMWSVHDRDEDNELLKIYECVQRWPQAKVKNCQYGIDQMNAY